MCSNRLFQLATFMQTHVEIKDRQSNSVSQRKFDLEGDECLFSLPYPWLQLKAKICENIEERKKMLKKLDIDNYKLSRIPRPGEDAKEAADKEQSKRVQR